MLIGCVHVVFINIDQFKYDMNNNHIKNTYLNAIYLIRYI